MSNEEEPRAPRRSIGARRHPAAEAAILRAAGEVLAEGGFAAFSIDAVARRSGAGKPTIYRWWPSRADLLFAVYEADRASRLLEPDTGTLVDDLTGLMRAVLASWRETTAGHALRGLVAEAQASEAALLVLWERFVPLWSRPLRAVFGAAARRGEIDAVDSELLVEFVAALLWRRLLTGQIDDDRTALERAARLLASGRGRKR